MALLEYLLKSQYSISRGNRSSESIAGVNQSTGVSLHASLEIVSTKPVDSRERPSFPTVARSVYLPSRFNDFYACTTYV
jgi:hypothetical protein